MSLRTEFRRQGRVFSSKDKTLTLELLQSLRRAFEDIKKLKDQLYREKIS